MIFTVGTPLLLFFIQLALLTNILAMCTRSSKKKQQQKTAQRPTTNPRRYEPPRNQFASLVSERSVKNVKPAHPPAKAPNASEQSTKTASKIRTPASIKQQPQRGPPSSIKEQRRVAPPASPSLDATQKSMRGTPKKPTNQPHAASSGQPLQILEPSGKPMKLEPSVLRWKPDGGIQTVSIRNLSQDRQAVKVKCSDNQLYRVNPVYSFIEPGKTLDVDILRQSGPAKVDKMVFVTAKADIEDATPYTLFDSNKPSASMVLPLIAQSA